MNKTKYTKYLYIPLIVIVIGVFLLPKNVYSTSITDENIIILTNEERTKNNIDEVTANQLLSQAAYKKGNAILENQIFSHTIDGKSFSQWIKDSGYKYTYIGENLAIDFVSSEGVVNAWLASPSHKKNLLNDSFKEIGVAVLEGEFQDENTILVVQVFGTPLDDEPLLIENINDDQNTYVYTEDYDFNNFTEKKQFYFLISEDHFLNNDMIDKINLFIFLFSILYLILIFTYKAMIRYKIFALIRNKIIGKNNQLKMPLG